MKSSLFPLVIASQLMVAGLFSQALLSRASEEGDQYAASKIGQKYWFDYPSAQCRGITTEINGSTRLKNTEPLQGEVSKIVANSFNRKYIEIVFQDGQRGYYPTSLAADEMKYADSDGGKHCFYPENPVEFWKNAKQKEALRIEQKRIREEKSQAIKEARAKLPGAKIGMTKKQVIEKTSWGEPDKINRTVTKAGEEEQWVYGDGNYLYFTNGKLTAMQN